MLLPSMVVPSLLTSSGELKGGAVLTNFAAALAGRPVYLCFDMDFFDPSCAPGVCTPTWGGASAREGLEFLQIAPAFLAVVRGAPDDCCVKTAIGPAMR